MVNHLLETRHPLASSVLRLCASAADPAFHSSPFFTSLHHYLLTSSFPYTLPSSVSRNSFVCRSYENTRGVGGILPTLNSALSFFTIHCPLPTAHSLHVRKHPGCGGYSSQIGTALTAQASTPLRAIIDFAIIDLLPALQPRKRAGMTARILDGKIIRDQISPS